MRVSEEVRGYRVSRYSRGKKRQIVLICLPKYLPSEILRGHSSMKVRLRAASMQSLFTLMAILF